jgi:hypothetical protein
VAQTAEYLRATPRFASLLSLLPCDLWALIRGRTLWLAGDSQSQRFYAQLRCFLADYAAEGQAGKEVPAVKDEQQRKVGGWLAGWWEFIGWPAAERRSSSWAVTLEHASEKHSVCGTLHRCCKRCFQTQPLGPLRASSRHLRCAALQGASTL